MGADTSVGEKSSLLERAKKKHKRHRSRGKNSSASDTSINAPNFLESTWNADGSRDSESLQGGREFETFQREGILTEPARRASTRSRSQGFTERKNKEPLRRGSVPSVTIELSDERKCAGQKEDQDSRAWDYWPVTRRTASLDSEQLSIRKRSRRLSDGSQNTMPFESFHKLSDFGPSDAGPRKRTRSTSARSVSTIVLHGHSGFSGWGSGTLQTPAQKGIDREYKKLLALKEQRARLDAQIAKTEKKCHQLEDALKREEEIKSRAATLLSATTVELAGRPEFYQSYSLFDLLAKEELRETLKHRLKSGANPNEITREGTILMRAVRQGLKDVVRLLMDAGADPGIQDEYGRTALFMAADLGNAEIVNILLSGDGDKKSVDVASSLRVTPLFAAVEGGFSKLADLLLTAKADINAKNLYGETPLILAASAGDSTICQLLIKRGANVNAEDHWGYSALCEAVEEDRSTELLSLLLKARCSPDASDRKFRPRPPVLHLAIEARNTDTIKLLLDSGADPFEPDENGDSMIDVLEKDTTRKNFNLIELVKAIHINALSNFVT